MNKKPILPVTAVLSMNICFTQKTPKEAKLTACNIKTNILYDAAAAFNPDVESGQGAKASLDVSNGWNPWEFRDKP